MAKRLAQLISFVFHPLLLPTYSFVLIIYVDPFLFGNYTLHQLAGITISVFINTFVFPVITILLMYKLGFIKSIYMQEGRERIVPFFGIIVFYIWTFMSFRKSVYPEILNITLLGACFAILLSFLITLFKKISLHTVGMGSLVGLMIVLCLISTYNLMGYLSVVILLAGIVGSARLALNAHDRAEIYGGYVIGITCQFLALHFF
jgi:hypothetical protein